LITFGDSRNEVWERFFQHITVSSHQNLINFLEELDLDIVPVKDVVRSSQDAIINAKRLRNENVESVILHLPSWAPPNLVIIAVTTVAKPPLILASRRNAGIVSMGASAGALSQLGIRHKRVLYDKFTEGLTSDILSFVRAASAIYTLKGQTFGVFGGRSLGMYTCMPNLDQWQQMFGIDIEHVDQLEIIREAERIPKERVEKFLNWLEKNCVSIDYDGEKLTKDKLELQIRCYLATKDIVKERKFDFFGVKCQPELSEKYVAQCLTAAFSNDNYDAEGPKEPIVCSCEVDADGALTMQILHLISGGKPVLMLDVGLDYIDGTYICGNCGGQSTWYSQRSDKPEENLKHVRLKPAWAPAGGAVTHYVCKPGEVTLARLYRKSGEYYMLILHGEIVEALGASELIDKLNLPIACVKFSMDLKHFIQEYGSNHIHAVIGDYTKELKDFCDLTGIKKIP
jgi:L-fucose isomerase